MTRTIKGTLSTTAVLLLLSTVTYAIFTNGGFEGGDFTGWTKSAFTNPGLTGSAPFSGSNIQHGGGGVDRTTVETGSTMALSDAIVPAVHYPRFGTRAARVNFWPANGASPSANVNSLLQQSIAGASDIDAADGLFHVRFAFLPVLEDGGHTAAQQAYFYVAVRNVTKGTTIWQRFSFAGEPGVPWQVLPVTVGGTTTNYNYTDWQAVDASGGPGVIDLGDTLELEVIASGCSLGGHRGHVYVDAFGSTIPGGAITATAPATTVPGAALTYHLHVTNDGASALSNPVVSIAVPAQTTFSSVTNPNCSHASGVVTCTLPDLAAGADVDFNLVVTVAGAASGTITLGNYSISGTGYPALLGPARTTVVNSPVAVSDSYTTTRNVTLVIAAPGVLANDTDPNGDALTAVLVTNPAHGTLTLNTDGSFTYNPHGGYTGPDSFIYRARDSSNTSSANTNVALTVTMPGTPVATADAYSVNEEATLTVGASGVLANDTDPTAQPLSAVLVTGTSHGTLTLDANGGFVYTPAANYSGPDAFSYRASDGTLQSSVVAVALTINPVNDPPAGVADSYSVAEDGSLTVNGSGVLANDIDPDGDPLTAQLITGPAHGTLTFNADGTVTYTPAPDYAGPDTVVYRASDGVSQSANTTVSITVTPVNDPPVPVSDSYSVAEDGVLTRNAAQGVRANDTDIEGDVLTIALVSDVSHGSLTLNGDGSFVYTPNADYTGPDGFTYSASDGVTTVSPIAVTIAVNAANDAPTGVADSYATAEDTALNVAAAPGVLANDSDPDGPSMTATLVTGPAHGTLALAADGSFLYTPAANYNGADSFVYRASDGSAESGDTTVSLTITAVADAPDATNDGNGGTYVMTEDGPLTVPAGSGVLANDSDPDGDPLTAVLVTGPTHGTLTLNPDGSFTYTPDANYNGPDSFVYHATDGSTNSSDATVTLNVTAVADEPTATADGVGGTFTLTEDGALNVPALTGVLANDADPDGDPITAVLVTPPAHGTLTLNPDGSFVYTPDANYNGPDSFVYRASDGTLQSGDTTVLLTVTPVEDPPTAGNDGVGGTFATSEDGPLTVPAPGVLGNDVDPDGDPLTAVLATGPAHGTLTFNPDGSFVYTPDADYSGPDSFTYTVSDGDQTSAPATVTLTVNPVNDPPTAVANTYSLGEDHTFSVPASSGLLANDSDVDPSTTLTAILVTGPAHGTLTLNPDGSFTYVPDANFNGVDTFTYQVSDGTTTSPPVTVTLNVGDDVTLAPGAGRDTGGTRVIIEGTGFGPAGTPVVVTIGGVPAPEAEVLDDGHITFVTPPLPPGTPVDVVVVIDNGPPETLPGAYIPMPVPAAGDPTDTDGDGITDEIELKYGLDPTDPGDADDDPDHDGVPSDTEIIQGTHPNAPYLRYFAEGINNAVFNTGIAVANASAATMEVQVTFFRQGEAPVRKNLTLTGRTRVMLNTATVPGMATAAFGVEVAGNEAVSADRTTFWDLGGREAHSEHAVEASPTWYFAEGATTGRFSLFYLLTNPSSQPANATVTFLRQVGAPIVKQMVVPGFARVTIPVNTADPGLASADLGGIVSADRPIVAERSMYLSSDTKIWEAGTGGTGVTAPANRWFFGEGATGSFFDAWILLSNPGSTDATVDVRYVADSGADVTRTHTVPAGRRITIRVVDEDAAMMNTSFATFVNSTNAVPVVAERAMWWRSDEGHWTAGHVGVGFTEGGKKWVTADGVAATDGSSDTYALVSNTESRPGTLKVTAVFDDGTMPVERLFAIGPNQRFTIRGRERFPEVVGKGYSFIIESIGAAPVDIVVDHSTYFDMDGRFWAMGTTSPGSKIR